MSRLGAYFWKYSHKTPSSVLVRLQRILSPLTHMTFLSCDPIVGWPITRPRAPVPVSHVLKTNARSCLRNNSFVLAGASVAWHNLSTAFTLMLFSVLPENCQFRVSLRNQKLHFYAGNIPTEVTSCCVMGARCGQVNKYSKGFPLGRH